MPTQIIRFTRATYCFYRPSLERARAGRGVRHPCWKFHCPRTPEDMKKLIVFDLDGTLADSQSSIDVEMAQLFDSLLRDPHETKRVIETLVACLGAPR